MHLKSVFSEVPSAISLFSMESTRRCWIETVNIPEPKAYTTRYASICSALVYVESNRNPAVASIEPR